ncbi:unnamed protein product, partial [Allacma fusca]
MLEKQVGEPESEEMEEELKKAKD